MMLPFQAPVPEDQQWVRPVYAASGFLGCEYTFGSLYVWCEAYHTEICQYKGFLLRRSGKDRPAYGMPVGGGNPFPVLEELMELATREGEPFRLWGLTEQEVRELEERLPGRFHYKNDRDAADYIYSAERLIRLPGRKYHSKRNHLAQFDRAYDWSYEDITAQNRADCLAVAAEWREENRALEGVEQEALALQKSFDAFDELGFEGGLIRIGGKPAAFTVGEEINERAYVLHFEKALGGYNGLYAAINNAFAKAQLGKYELINREEDLGLEGLRKAKLSYRPQILLEKYLCEAVR